MDTIKLTIDSKEVEIEAGASVLQACERAGIEVPVFCYHPKLSVAGNCRMCLVEMEKSPKPVASCAMPAADGMVIRTNTEMVRKARKGVLEFLLINHPLDCPICDQGGECDLQDITMSYGPDTSRFKENKRAVENKDFGPLIKTIMTRCIHCTRCVRFSDEIAGSHLLGAVHRGEQMEISTYVKEAINSELSGNMIDICPVGALTSKPYAFQGRSWELKKTESIDVHDAVGASIRVDSRGSEVMRILPRTNVVVNEEWISDKTRFSCDGLKFQRLDRPYLRRGKDLKPCSWVDALAAASQKMMSVSGEKIAGLVGPLADCESIFALKELLESISCFNTDCRLKGEYLPSNHRAGYLFNTTIESAEEADVVLIVGSNPRVEAPLINARFRKQYLANGIEVGLVGKEVDLSYPYTHLGDTAQVLREIYNEKHAFAKKLKKAKKPMLVLGMGALTRSDSKAIYDICIAIAAKYGLISNEKNDFNILHTDAAMVGALDLGFVPGKSGETAQTFYDRIKSGGIKVLYLLGADDIPLNKSDLKDTFVIYQGHHGDRGAQLADLILPGSAYTEKDATYVNTEGRVQQAFKAVWAPGEAKEDWRILKAISDYLETPLPYETLEQLRTKMKEVAPTFRHPQERVCTLWPEKTVETIVKCAEVSDFLPRPLFTTIRNFYMTNVINYNSITMAECTKAFVEQAQEKQYA